MAAQAYEETEDRFEKTMQMGMGEAIQRLNLLHAKISRGIAIPDEPFDM